MTVPKTYEDLLSLIKEQVEESTHIEFKRGINKEDGKWRKELAKDISAMANSDGGIIIYGIAEKKIGELSVASEITPLKDIKLESFDQIINSKIQPVIKGIEFISIAVPEKDGFVYVVSVPKSDTAHQNLYSYQYHKRRNVIVEPMEDYEVRDTMNRNKFPKIDLEFTIEKQRFITRKIKTFDIDNNLLNAKPNINNEYIINDKYFLIIRFVNKGNLYAKYINGIVEIPSGILKESDSDDYAETFVIKNTKRDIVGFDNNHPRYGTSWYDPLLPGLSCQAEIIELELPDYKKENLIKDMIIKYSVFADNAPCFDSFINVRDIEVQQGKTHIKET